MEKFFKFRPLAYLEPCETSMMELFFSLNNHQLMFYFCYGYINPGRTSSVAILELFGQIFVNSNNFDVREFSKAPPKMLFWMLFSKSHGNQFSQVERSEITHSLNSDSFLQALRWVIVRRGNIKVSYSDNGTNFVGCANELKKAYKEMDNERIQAFMQSLGGDLERWIGNPPAANHMGGVWD